MAGGGGGEGWDWLGLAGGEALGELLDSLADAVHFLLDDGAPVGEFVAGEVGRDGDGPAEVVVNAGEWLGEDEVGPVAFDDPTAAGVGGAGDDGGAGLGGEEDDPLLELVFGTAGSIGRDEDVSAGEDSEEFAEGLVTAVIA